MQATLPDLAGGSGGIPAHLCGWDQEPMHFSAQAGRQFACGAVTHVDLLPFSATIAGGSVSACLSACLLYPNLNTTGHHATRIACCDDCCRFSASRHQSKAFPPILGSIPSPSTAVSHRHPPPPPYRKPNPCFHGPRRRKNHNGGRKTTRLLPPPPQRAPLRHSMVGSPALPLNMGRLELC